METLASPLRPVKARRIAEPDVWEDRGIARSFEGPYTHIIEFDWHARSTKRQWLYCEGISYEAVGTLNGMPIGIHQGIWDAFAWEITPALRSGRNRLEITVTKNGGTRFPVPQVLSGFLPYVSCSFGGLWQPVWLFETGEAWLSALWVRGEADGRVQISGTVVSETPATLLCTIEDAKGTPLYTASMLAQGDFTHQGVLSDPRPWSPDTPTLYRCRVQVRQNGRKSHTVEQIFGLRTLQRVGNQILLNGIPFYPRGLLHWGWYLTTHAPNPSREVAVRELESLKLAGFNMLKACLWVPPDWYLTLCDTIGVPVWLELPLWLPQIPPDQQDALIAEYATIVRQVRHHPSIMLWTLGCELSSRFPPEILHRLYQSVRSLTGSPLVRDNSGGSECYGGTLKEHADFADYHLYGDAHFAYSTFLTFLDTPRSPQPWLQGEFADHDTMRDFIGLRKKVAPNYLWWLSQDPNQNPQGVRWFYETPFVEERLKAQGLWEALPELVTRSRLEMVAYHKLILETMRRLHGTAGYVVTGLKDTPISTAGLLDEQGEPKVALETYRAFNSDTVLLLDWARRRVWQAGGDRPANLGLYNHVRGQTVYPRLLLSHFGKPLPPVLSLRWRLQVADTEQASGQEVIDLPQGDPPVFLCQLEIPLPELSAFGSPPKPLPACFEVHLEGYGKPLTSNRWRWRLYPRPEWRMLGQVAVYDPSPHFGEWDLEPTVFLPSDTPPTTETLLLATALPAWLAEWVAEGGRCVVWLPPLRQHTVSLPFWREATHQFLPHRFWEQLGFMPDYLDETLFAFSTDYALLPRACIHQESQCAPLWQRIDTRTGYRHVYLCEERLGKGHAFVTTLHFAGEHGDTPRTLTHHPAGQYWLYALLRYLAER